MRRYRWQRLMIPGFIALGVVIFLVAFFVTNGSLKPTAWFPGDDTATAGTTVMTSITVDGKTVSVPVKVKGRTITVPHTVVSTHGELVTIAGGVVQIPGPGQTVTKQGGVTTITGPGGTTTVISTLPGTTITGPTTTITGPGTTVTGPTQTVTSTMTVTLPPSTVTDTQTVTVTTTQPPVS